MNGTEAQLYISWKHDKLNYHMQGIECFLLRRPDHYLEFHKYVQNIIDCGKEARLKQIQESLDSLLEKDREKKSEVAKSRPSPLGDNSSHRCKALRK
jgi:hypothetical protein